MLHHNPEKLISMLDDHGGTEGRTHRQTYLLPGVTPQRRSTKIIHHIQTVIKMPTPHTETLSILQSSIKDLNDINSIPTFKLEV